MNYMSALFLAGATQGIVLALAISLKSKLKQLSRIFLIAFVLVVTLQILFKVIAKDWIGNYFNYFGIIAYQIPFLFGPVSFLYVRAAVDKQYRFRFREIVHFLPFILAAGIVTVFLLGVSDLQYILPNNWARGILYMSLQLITSVFYALKSWRLLTNPAEEDRWLRQFIAGSAITGIITTITLCLMYNLYPDHQQIRYMLLAQGIFIYWITYKAINNTIAFEAASFSSIKKYNNNPLTEDKALLITDCLMNAMEKDKLFLDAGLGIEKLSDVVGQSKHDISRILNERMNANFFDFVNGYRVREARRLLDDPAMQRFTIAAIAFESGFNSVSAFNSAFKKFEGITPSAYRKRAVTN